MSDLQQRRILREFKSLQDDIEPGWSVELYYPNDLTRWRLYLKGPCQTPYENGQFQLSARFPSTYPFVPPEFYFDTKIFHPNISSRGEISIDHSSYETNTRIHQFLQEIQLLLSNPNSDCFLDRDAAFLYVHNRREFEERATEWTKLHATDDEIISDGSDSSPPSAIISPQENSPNESPARSPCPSQWMFQPINNSIEKVSNDRWYNYPKREQLALERAYRSDLSVFELNNNLISFSHGIQYCENGDCSRMKRNTPKKKRNHRRYKHLSFHSNPCTSDDPIIRYCLDSSVSTSLSTVVAGIRLEGNLSGQESRANQLLACLEVIDKNDEIAIGLECICLYTKDSFLSKSLNRFLRERNCDKINTLGPFCMILLSQFDRYRTDLQSLKLYRGEYLRTAALRAYKRGAGKGRHQWLGFTSTTKRKELAEVFTRNALFIIRLEKIYNDGRALDISLLSQFDEEDEVLLRPGVEFSIDKFEYDEVSKKYTFFLIAYI